ncbi:MAG: hypothetical protein HYY40_02505 [Bacteroidetes bacterium]|nr:hypothetical protein [Bacteroidota bacterium]
MNKIRKAAIGILLILVLFIIIISAVTYILTARYEKEITGYFTSYLNNRLNSEVTVSSIEFTVFRSFPFAGVTMKNIFVTSALSEKDTLLQAERLSLSFRLPDIFSKNFSVRRAEISNGYLKIIVSDDNRSNYEIWKSGEAPGEAVRFSLSSLLLERMNVHVEHHPADVVLDTRFAKGIFTGLLTPPDQQIEMNSTGIIFRFDVNGVRYVTDKETETHVVFTIRNDKYRFSEGNVQTGDYGLDFSGTCDLSGKEAVTDLLVSIKKFNLENLQKNIPDKFSHSIKDYRLKGLADIRLKIKGKLSGKRLPSVILNFTARNGTFNVADDNRTKSDMNLLYDHVSGVFTAADLLKQSSMQLTLDSFSVRSENSHGSGILEIRNFRKPQFSLSGNFSISTNDFPGLAPDSVNIQTGILTFMGNCSGPLRPVGELTSGEAGKIDIAGRVSFSCDKITPVHPAWQVDRMNVLCHFGSDTLYVDEMRCNALGGDIYFNGTMAGFPACLLIPGFELLVDGLLQADILELSYFFPDSSDATGAGSGITMPPQLALNLRLALDRIVMRKFEGKNVAGKLNYSNGVLIINPVSFTTLDGVFRGKWLADASNGDHTVLSCDADIQKIDVRKLFTTMKNFGQDYITDRHLNGIVTAKVQFASVWKQGAVIIPEKIFSTGDIIITKGELKDFKPLEQLSDYIALTELKDVKFSTLNNRIEIRDRKIFIPEMEVRSSAINLTM